MATEMETSRDNFLSSALKISHLPPSNSDVFHFSSDVFSRYPPDLEDNGFIRVSRQRGKKFQKLNPSLTASSSTGTADHRSAPDLASANMFPPLKSESGSTARSELRSVGMHGCTNVFASPRSWRDVTVGAEIPVKSPLTFYAPVIHNNMKCAEISVDLLNAAKKEWDNSIVLYVLGSKPYYPYFKAYISRVWKPVGSFQIFSKENGFYVVRFDDKDDCERILDNGPYYYDRKLIMMRKWSSGMKLTKEFLKSVPVWVRLNNLNLEFWTEESISRIASILGNPIKLDSVTEGMIRISYARVLIEIDNNFSFPDKVPLYDASNDTVLWQDVEYEWYPPKCSNCSCFGHLDRYCSFKKIWIPKESCNDYEPVNTMDVDNSKDHSNVDDSNGSAPHAVGNSVQQFHVNIPLNINDDTTADTYTDNNVSVQSDPTESINLQNSDLNLEQQMDRTGLIVSDSKDKIYAQTVSDNVCINACQEVQTDLFPQLGHTDLLLQMIRDKDSSTMIDNKKKLVRKQNGDENAFQFSAEASADIIENPNWKNLALQCKNKAAKSKKKKL